MDGTGSVLSSVVNCDLRIVESYGCMQGKWKIMWI